MASGPAAGCETAAGAGGPDIDVVKPDCLRPSSHGTTRNTYKATQARTGPQTVTVPMAANPSRSRIGAEVPRFAYTAANADPDVVRAASNRARTTAL